MLSAIMRMQFLASTLLIRTRLHISTQLRDFRIANLLVSPPNLKERLLSPAGRYHVKKFLGEGGKKKVYLGRGVIAFRVNPQRSALRGCLLILLVLLGLAWTLLLSWRVAFDLSQKVPHFILSHRTPDVSKAGVSVYLGSALEYCILPG